MRSILINAGHRKDPSAVYYNSKGVLAFLMQISFTGGTHEKKSFRHKIKFIYPIWFLSSADMRRRRIRALRENRKRRERGKKARRIN